MTKDGNPLIEDGTKVGILDESNDLKAHMEDIGHKSVKENPD